MTDLDATTRRRARPGRAGGVGVSERIAAMRLTVERARAEATEVGIPWDRYDSGLHALDAAWLLEEIDALTMTREESSEIKGELRAEVERLRTRVRRLYEALALAKSMVLSGESMSLEAAAQIRAAMAVSG